MEKVNTGGLTEIRYPRGWKPSDDPEFDERWDRALRVGRRRKRREKLKNSIIFGIILIMIGIILIILPYYNIFKSNIEIFLLCLLMIFIGLIKIFFTIRNINTLKKSDEWFNQEDVDYHKEQEEDEEANKRRFE
jgi:hypothetical protein